MRQSIQSHMELQPIQRLVGQLVFAIDNDARQYLNAVTRLRGTGQVVAHRSNQSLTSAAHLLLSVQAQGRGSDRAAQAGDAKSRRCD